MLRTPPSDNATSSQRIHVALVSMMQRFSPPWTLSSQTHAWTTSMISPSIFALDVSIRSQSMLMSLYKRYTSAKTLQLEYGVEGMTTLLN